MHLCSTAECKLRDVLDVDIQMERNCLFDDEKKMSYEDHLSAEGITCMYTAPMIKDIATRTIQEICNSLIFRSAYITLSVSL